MLPGKTATALSLLGFTCVLSLSPLVAAQSEPPAPAQSTTAQPAPAQPAPAQPAPAQPATPPAATSRPSNPQSRAGSLYRRHTIDERVKSFAKALDLNETQQEGLKAVLERQQLQARQTQFDSTLSGQERIGKFRALQDDTVLRIRALLNDEQKKKYDPINHGTQAPGSSDSYVDQWMKYHERSDQPPQAPKK
jgi:hypothetical protein